MELTPFVFATVSKIMEIPEKDLCLETDFVMELGSDEYDMHDIVLDVEEEFGITIEDAEIESLNTIQDLIDLATKKMQ